MNAKGDRKKVVLKDRSPVLRIWLRRIKDIYLYYFPPINSVEEEVVLRFAGDRMFMSSSAREPMAGCSSRAAERAYRILRILSHREKARRPAPAAPPVTLEVRAHTEETEAAELIGFLLKLPNLFPDDDSSPREGRSQASGSHGPDPNCWMHSYVVRQQFARISGRMHFYVVRRPLIPHCHARNGLASSLLKTCVESKPSWSFRRVC